MEHSQRKCCKIDINISQNSEALRIQIFVWVSITVIAFHFMCSYNFADLALCSMVPLTSNGGWGHGRGLGFFLWEIDCFIGVLWGQGPFT
jgi:hypothetical protein